MAIKTNFFDNASYYPADLVNQWKSLLSDGVYNVGTGALAVTAHSPANLSVDVAIGACTKSGYYINSDTVVNAAIAANTSGYNRIDIIVIEVDTTNKLSAIKAVQGTPSSSPTAPLPTENQLKLAEVFVGNNVSVINLANITDSRINIDLTGTNGVYSTNGYHKLPSGMIIQWGRVYLSNPGTGATYFSDITYPIAFPTSVASLTTSMFNASGADPVTFNPQFNGATSTGATLRIWNQIGNNPGAIDVSWMAIGY